MVRGQGDGGDRPFGDTDNNRRFRLGGVEGGAAVLDPIPERDPRPRSLAGAESSAVEEDQRTDRSKPVEEVRVARERT